MHDIDRTQFEYEPEDSFETGDFEFEPEDLSMQAESPFSEQEEINLASQLLEITDDVEIDQFLGNVFKKAWRGIRKVAPSVVRPLGSILKGVMKKALPIAGGALGTMVGGPVGGMLGSKLASGARSMFGLEVEGLRRKIRILKLQGELSGLQGQQRKKQRLFRPPHVLILMQRKQS